MMIWLRSLSLGLTLAVSACAELTSAPVVPMAAVVQATANLNDQERYMVYEGNARRVFKRLDDQLKAKGV
jgi:hypothetical protein